MAEDTLVLSGMNPYTSVRSLCKCFVIFIIFFTVVLLASVYRKPMMLEMQYSYMKKKPPPENFPKPTVQHKYNCETNMANGTITPVAGTKTYVIAAYLDFRSIRSVRVLGIVNRDEYQELFCRFCFINGTNVVRAEMQVHADHFNFPYGTADLLCDLKDDRIPTYVSVSVQSNPKDDSSLVPYLRIQNIKRQLEDAQPASFEYDFLVCISTMFGDYNNVLQFIQAIEMYKILGAQKVIIYKTRCSKLLEKVINFYVQLGFVEVMPWPITKYLNVSSGWHFPEHPGELHYYGQTATLNDCVYRNMYRSKYIILNDIDEVILPVKHENWYGLMEYLNKDSWFFSAFIFKNHVFPSTKEYKSSSSVHSYWNGVPGVDMLSYVNREPNIPDESNPTKMIINPRNIMKTSVHTPLEFTGEQYWVSSEDAKLCHYREAKQPELAKESLIEDTILLKYEALLISSVNHALWEVGIFSHLVPTSPSLIKKPRIPFLVVTGIVFMTLVVIHQWGLRKDVSWW